MKKGYTIKEIRKKSLSKRDRKTLAKNLKEFLLWMDKAVWDKNWNNDKNNLRISLVGILKGKIIK
jgi:hypothetical protein